MKKLLSFYIAFLLGAGSAVAQQADSAATDTTQQVMPDSLNQTTPESPVDSLQQEENEPVIVIPWQQTRPLASRQVATDSTLRWQIWPNWGDYYAYRTGVISYRQGSSGQVDAFHIDGYLPNEQEVRMEGIRLNNPVTGLVNYNLVPHHKILEVNEQPFAILKTSINLKDYYITKPISYLNYDESKYNYRNLEFMVTQNFTAKTNLELSYWDRRDGGYYPRDDVQGSQIYGKLYHHLNPNFQLRALYLRNQYNNEEPFGYIVGNPQNFAFDRYASPPQMSSASSSFTRWDLVTGIYHRADTASAEDTGLEIFLSKNKNDVFYSTDTLNTDITSAGARLYREQELGLFTARAEAEGILHSATDASPLIKSSWQEFNLEGTVEYSINKANAVFASGELQSRAGYSGYESGGGIRGRVSIFSYRFGAYTFHRLPAIQASYWSSDEYAAAVFGKGNEKGNSINGMLEMGIGDYFRLGVQARLSNVDSYTLLSREDSTFQEGGGYESINGTVYTSFENHRFEISSSASYQQVEYEQNEHADPVYHHLDDVLWIRNAAFIKGYAFQRATYLKAGLKSLLSPLSYSSRTYNTALGFWQANSDYQEIPAFFRLDAEVSARVRGFMVVMRWENVLEGFGQAGYFEAAGYPMPPRRLVIGIRARFIN